MELARGPTIFIQKYLSFLLFTRARAYLKRIYLCKIILFFKKKSKYLVISKKSSTFAGAFGNWEI